MITDDLIKLYYVLLLPSLTADVTLNNLFLNACLMSRRSARIAPQKQQNDDYDYYMQANSNWNIEFDSDEDVTDLSEQSDDEGEAHRSCRKAKRQPSKKKQRKGGKGRSRAAWAAAGDEDAEAIEDAGGSDAGSDVEEEPDQGLGFEVRTGTWNAEEYAKLADEDKQRVKESTRRQYRHWQNGYAAYCKEKKLNPDAVTEMAGMRQLSLFFDDWCSGRWRPNKKKGQKIAPSTVKGFHSAMRKMINYKCLQAGKAKLDPKEDPGYMVMYTKYSQGAGLKRTHQCFAQFTRDSHMKLCQSLFAMLGKLTGAVGIVGLALVTLAIACVARGDEIRSILLMSFGCQEMEIIGPAMCYAFTFALGERKVNNGHPDHKVFIRNRVPEACPVGAIGRLLWYRFTMSEELLPEPGSPDWKKLYLFPGRNNAWQMSYSMHKSYITNAMRAAKVFSPKRTHTFRVYAAQLMVAMGVALEAIQRLGGWLMDCLGTAYIVFAANPQALLALGCWRSDNYDYQCFYAPRFYIGVSEALVYYAFPQLKGFYEAAEAAVQAAAEGENEHQKAAEFLALAKVMRQMITAAIQDAVELADKYPDNEFIKFMEQHEEFQLLKAQYPAFMELGGFDHLKPVPIRQQLSQLHEKLSQIQQQQQQQHIPTATAAGSFQFQQFSSTFNSSSFGMSAGFGPQQQQQQQQAQSSGMQDAFHTQGTGAGPAAGGAAAAAGTAAGAAIGQSPVVFCSPSGGRREMGDLLPGYTPQGMRSRNLWHPSQQVPFGCGHGQSQQQQQWQGQQQHGQHGQQQQQQQHGQQHVQQEQQHGQGQQQHGQQQQQWQSQQNQHGHQQQQQWQGQQHQQQWHGQQWHGGQQQWQQQQQHPQGFSGLIEQLLQHQQEQQQLIQQIRMMPPTPETGLLLERAVASLARIEASLQNIRQMQQSSQQQAAAASGAAAAAAGVSARMGWEPLASMMQPTISSDPSLAGVVGAGTMAGMPAGAGSQVAGVMGWMAYCVKQAVREELSNHVGSANQGGAGQSSGRQHQAQQQQQHPKPQQQEQQKGQGKSKTGSKQLDYRTPSQFRSMHEFLQYYTVEKIRYVEDGATAADSDEVVMKTRKEIADAGGKWSKVRQRQNDLDILYRYVEAEAVRLASLKSKFFSIQETVAELEKQHKLGQKGGMTLSQLRDLACSWNSQQKKMVVVAAEDAEEEAEGAGEGTATEGEVP